MQNLVILGAGTAGTTVANKLRQRLPQSQWSITVVDPSSRHYYQPGFLFIPFDMYEPAEVVKPTAEFFRDGIEFIAEGVSELDPASNTVFLETGRHLSYDYLVIATGTHPRPDQTPGLEEDPERIHHFYSLEASVDLRNALRTFQRGRLVVNIVDVPIKCPVAPLEFAFLADAHFADRGTRDDVEIIFVTPLDAAFTKPVAASRLSGMLEERGIRIETDFYMERVDADTQRLVSYDEREVPYDLLVSIPVNMGADFVGRAGLGDELNHVEVDRHTFQSNSYANIFALGDAANLPTSKAGSTAHFSADIFTDNFVALLDTGTMPEAFDGHANCFVESGSGKAMLIDFNYDVQPLPGSYPLARVGPFPLLSEARRNHWAKLFFRWVYWNLLIRGRWLPFPARMSMAGKVTEPERPVGVR